MTDETVEWNSAFLELLIDPSNIDSVIRLASSTDYAFMFLSEAARKVSDKHFASAAKQNSLLRLLSVLVEMSSGESGILGAERLAAEIYGRLINFNNELFREATERTDLGHLAVKANSFSGVFSVLAVREILEQVGELDHFSTLTADELDKLLENTNLDSLCEIAEQSGIAHLMEKFSGWRAKLKPLAPEDTSIEAETLGRSRVVTPHRPR